MTTRQAARLDDRGLVEVRGATARDFLSGLVTSEMDAVREGAARNAALLTPQGKILFEFIVSQGDDDALLLDAPAALVDELVKRLMFYRLRAKLEIARRDDLAVAAVWGGDAAPDIDGAFADPRLAALGWRAIAPEDDARATMTTADAAAASIADYHAMRIAHGVAELQADYPASEVFPHEANLDQLAGVDFDKGCFVGQEVVSRMQHRGTARKRFLPVGLIGAAPPQGVDIHADGKVVGSMGSSSGDRGLALLRLDRIAGPMAAGQPLQAGETGVVPIKPAWARFAWPGDASAEAM